jgi:transcriptional regulator with XRE-family HTH domain
MDLQTFLKKTGKRQELAGRLGISKNYLWQVATGNAGRRPSPKLAKRIHEETLGVVSLETLRPDIWGINKSDS